MKEVTFTSQIKFELAKSLINNNLDSCEVLDDRNTISFTDDRIARLFEGINTGEQVVLIFPHQEDDYWLITGNYRFIIEETRNRINSFLNYSYGTFDEAVPRLYEFNPDQNQIQKYCSELFNIGYYRWSSPRKYRDRILDRLMVLDNLEREQPKIVRKQKKTYRQLGDEFERAINKDDWDKADFCLSELKRLHLCTAENFVFLNLQLLGAKNAWKRIWEHPDYPVWAQLPMPRKVRTVMLAGYYHCELEQIEKEGLWINVLEKFKSTRQRLGLLLTGPFELDNEINITIISYQAIADQDISRINLINSLEGSNAGKDILSNLQSSINNEFSQIRPESLPYQEAISALKIKDYAVAERWVTSIDDIFQRTLVLLELAFFTQDHQIKEVAWHSYQSMSYQQQEKLTQFEDFVEKYLENLRDYALPFQENIEPEIGDENWPPTSNEMRNQTWLKVEDIERRLRSLIVERYLANFGDDWVSRLHPDMVGNWNEMMERDKKSFSNYDNFNNALIDYSYLGDLKIIIERNWQLFTDKFGEGKENKRNFHRKIEAVIRVRNPLAHHRNVPENELMRARVNATDLIIMLQ